MWNARLQESQAGIKTAERNISNLKYADDATPVAEGWPPEELMLLNLNCAEEDSWESLGQQGDQTSQS